MPNSSEECASPHRASSTRVHETLAALTRRRAPAVIDPGLLPFDEADLFAAVKRAVDETGCFTKREYLDGLRRLLARLPDEPGERQPWLETFEAAAYALYGFSFTGYRGNATLIDAADYLPRDGHERFGEYLAWLAAQDDEIGYQTPGIQVASPRLATALRTLVKGCLPGDRMARTYMNSFYGTYRATPAGVHVDPHHAHSFQVVLRGTRELWCWNARDVAGLERPDRLLGVTRPHESEFEIPPIRLVIREGEIAYWPGHYAHCLTADGPSVAVTLVVEHAPGDPDDQLRTMARSLVGSTGAARTYSGLPAVSSIPDAIEVLTLRMRSMGAWIMVCPPGLPALPAGPLRSRLDPDFPMALSRLSDGRLVIAVNGLVFEVPGRASEDELGRLVAHLNTVESTALDALCERHATGTLDRSQLGSVLRMGLAADAFSAA